MDAIVKHFIFVAFLMSNSIAEGRILKLYSSDDHLISDGTLYLSSCIHQFGFLPCAENVVGYLFLIFVYLLLLVVGGQMISSGSEVLIDIFQAKAFSGIIFRILMALPSMMLMILSGVFGSKENAQSQVSVGVGVNAGITVFSLTIRWGIVLMGGRIDLNKKNKQSEASSQWERFTSIFKDTGVRIDEKTRDTAGLMLLSLIPYLVLQLVFVFDSLFGNRIITLIALAISSLSLLLYFIYQIWNPQMLQRSLEYSKLVNQEGLFELDVLKELFDHIDIDNDGYIDRIEMRNLVSNTFSAGITDTQKNDGIEQIMEVFDKYDDRGIDLDEFIRGFKNWYIKTARSASENQSFLKETTQQLLQLFEDKKEKSRRMDKIMSKILMHFEGQLPKSESLITDQWEPNMKSIHELFNKLDTDRDEYISEKDLKKHITRGMLRSYQLNKDQVLQEVFNRDKNASSISKEQFVDGIKKYVEKAIQAVYISGSEGNNIIEEFDRIIWSKENRKRGLFKSSFQVLFGIALTFLSGPLAANIIQLSSHALGVPSIISFIVVPLAMNAKQAVEAILPASMKREKTASLTFSEIYSGVIMNNTAGLTALLAVVYAKGLVWSFSAEVVTILVVCGAIGTLAFLRKTYQLWTIILASFLYLFSIAFYVSISVFL